MSNSDLTSEALRTQDGFKCLPFDNDGRSNASTKSKRSSRSSHAGSTVSTKLALKRAKAEAARAGIGYALQEANLRVRQARIQEQKELSLAQAAREKAELDADLNVLEQRKQAAMAEAEVKVLQSVENNSQCSQESLLQIPVEDSTARTEEYVSNQSECLMFPPKQVFPSTPTQGRSFQPHRTASVGQGTNMIPDQTAASLPQLAPPTHLNPMAEPYRPMAEPIRGSHSPTRHEDTSAMTDLTRFLLKKDLMLTRLTHFDDRPESYQAWKTGFINIMDDLRVTDSEELDLLSKWLGPESSKFARSLRSANIADPRRGLQRVWQRLDERYGCPELVEAALKAKLANFPKLTNRDSKKLFELSDILSEIEAVKNNDSFGTLLAYFDSSSGVIPIVSKLPYGLQEKWTAEAIRYKCQHNVVFPPFSFFVDFIRDLSRAKNDPSFYYETSGPQTAAKPAHKVAVSVKKTDVSLSSSELEKGPDTHCPLHKARHPLNECRNFKTKPIAERKQIIKDNGICFRCCASTKHMANACKATVQCGDCGSGKHPTALHIVANKTDSNSRSAVENVGGEPCQQTKPLSTPVTANCTQICGTPFKGKSCGKTILLNVYPKDKPECAKRMYVIIDDQSNSSLGRSEFFDHFQVESELFPYYLSSCSGRVAASGRRAHGFVIESLDGSAKLELPTVTECNMIPNVREEIATPEVAQCHPHLNDIATHIPPLDNDAQILLLIGRDIVEAHHILDQRIGGRGAPYAQKLCLGWTIIGEVCLGKVHQPHVVSVNKTYVLRNGRTSICEPCPNEIDVKGNIDERMPDHITPKSCNPVNNRVVDIGETVFNRTPDDDKIGLSVNDREFLSIMDREMFRNPDGNWVAPLPFCSPRPRLPNNRPQALKRAKSLDRDLHRNPLKRKQFTAFMQRVIDNNHAELAPPLDRDEECWYLPIFGVYHPRKPDQLRAVFDSSALHEGVSLNKVLLSGPDMTNSLLGVLLRFRQEPVALMTDIEQMFYCFLVREDHRNFLRFLWYRNNDPDDDLVEYRMRVHVFGNSPSPAVATYGLRKATELSAPDYGKDVKDFVDRNFYVDDGLKSLPYEDTTVDLMKRTQQALLVNGNLRLHKIASNSKTVMSAFPTEDYAKDIKDLDLGMDPLPIQRSLGLSWDLKSDSFKFQVSSEIKPYTRRGILSTVNSIFDPIGFLGPVIIQGKILLRELMSDTKDWDEPLDPERQAEWEQWRSSLAAIEQINIPRTYIGSSLQDTVRRDIHVFSDASEKAIAAVAYLRTVGKDGDIKLGFIIGKTKVAPGHGHTIPRLELCAAVLAVELAEMVTEQLDIAPESHHFYTDSKVILGYIHNQTRRFQIYVSNRVERIRRFSLPIQWRYVSTGVNPADQGTRPLHASELADSVWLNGPPHLKQDTDKPVPEFVDPESDNELTQAVTMATAVSPKLPVVSERFSRFSTWRTLVKTIAHLKHIARSYHQRSDTCRGWHICQQSRSVKLYNEAEKVILRSVQETFSGELQCLRAGKPLRKGSPLTSLNPFIDSDGILRVGGRLQLAEMNYEVKHPIIIPRGHHVSTLLVRHFHENVRHQGRHLTEGAVREAGYWIIGGKKLVSSVIYKCVDCRKLRGKRESQKMADLPADRLTPGPPFSHVGVDTFGPWEVVTRRTRGGQALNKRWAILFTCLTTRAIHIEVVEDMSTSSFINALRRFIAIRGNVDQFRSDRGTNFVGCTDALKIDTINVEDSLVQDFLYKKGVTWVFNPPHSSHMGGVWERMIGITRRILDSMLKDISSRNLTHEVLCTFLAEVCAIVNARPITPVSSDPDCPVNLTPSMLLTQKSNHVVEPLQDWNIQDLYKTQWKRVQALADVFWNRWRREYLQTLQCRRKWQEPRPDLSEGDVVLLVDNTAHRNHWPTGLIQTTMPGSDGKIRKAVVRVIRDGKPVTYTRPVTELVLLVPRETK